MPKYVLKQYRREDPNSSVGTKVYEWAFSADDVPDAVTRAKGLLVDYRPPDDFAGLWDESGKMVWDEVWDA